VALCVLFPISINIYVLVMIPDFPLCHVGQFRCENALCIPASFHCDGYRDCQDGTDEQNCTAIACPGNKFLCPHGEPGGIPRCIPRSSLCDGKKDCEDSADEETACCEYINISSVQAGALSWKQAVIHVVNGVPFNRR